MKNLGLYLMNYVTNMQKIILEREDLFYKIIVTILMWIFKVYSQT